MAKQSFSPGVLFFKRLIAAALALIILTLAGLAIYYGAALRRTRLALSDVRTRLEEKEVAELEKIAQEEAERLKNALPPEQEKPTGELSALEILDNTRVIAHALGTTDGIEGLNCLEGFLQHYDAGVRVFEADLRMSSDGYVVLRHDWLGDWQEDIGETAIPTREKFLATPILGKYTPLSFRDLLLLLVKYPDVCIITDTKFLEPEAVTTQIRSMVDEAHRLGLTYLFDRIVIQVYSPNHFYVVDGVHHFPHYIYTLYQESFGQSEEAFRRKAIFCEENGIMGLALWDYWWSPDYEAIADWRSIRVYAHTINDPHTANRLISTGVSAVYTDILDPEDLE